MPADREPADWEPAGRSLPAPTTVDDPNDARLAPFVALTDPALRRAHLGPRGEGLFIVESVEVARQVLGQPANEIVAIAVTPAGLRRLGPDLAGPAPVYLVPDAVLAAVAGFNVHRGVLVAVARPQPRTVAEVVADAGPLLVVIEGVNDQVNLGAIFRNAAALGVGGLVICPRCCDPLYRRTVRVSMGSVLRVPWARVEAGAWPGALYDIAAAGFTIEALTPSGPQPLLPRRHGERVAVVVGSEGAGLSPAALAAADRRVAIPMARGIDSLNVAAACAIAFWAHAPAVGPAGAAGQAYDPDR